MRRIPGSPRLTGDPVQSGLEGPLDPGGTASSWQRQYGAQVEVGNGRARTYIVLDQKSGDPVEVGVAPSF